jgi:hypothetical protein
MGGATVAGVGELFHVRLSLGRSFRDENSMAMPLPSFDQRAMRERITDMLSKPLPHGEVP